MGSSSSKSDGINNTNKIDTKKVNVIEDDNIDINSIIYISSGKKFIAKQPLRLLRYGVKDISELKKSLESKM